MDISSFVSPLLESFLLYPLIFILLLLNGFLSFPSSQILYLFLGYFFAHDTRSLFFLAFFGALGNSAGNILLHFFSQKKGVTFIKKIYKNADAEIEKILPSLKKKTYLYVFVAKMIPAIKVFVPLATGLLPFKKKYLFIIFFLASYLWAWLFLSVGALAGASSSLPRFYTLLTLFILVGIGIAKRKEIQKIIETKKKF